MDCLIQQAVMEDLPEVAEIELLVEGENGASPETLRRRILMFPEGFLVARLAGRLMGYAESCLWNEPRPIFGKEPGFFAERHRPDGAVLYLIFLAVHPDFQRQGVAGKLLQEIRQVAARHGAKKIHAVTCDHLIPLYTAQGFQPMAHLPGFLPTTSSWYLEYRL